MLYAIINITSQIVERVIVWDGKTAQNIPPGHSLVRSEFSRVGARYDVNTGMFVSQSTGVSDAEEEL
jgi:hypothetical protein